MTTRIAFTSSLFLAAMLLLPSSMASSLELTGACLKDAKAQCPGVEGWRRPDQGLPQVAHQGPVRRVQGGVAQGGKRQGLRG